MAVANGTGIGQPATPTSRTMRITELTFVASACLATSILAPRALSAQAPSAALPRWSDERCRAALDSGRALLSGGQARLMVEQSRRCGELGDRAVLSAIPAVSHSQDREAVRSLVGEARRIRTESALTVLLDVLNDESATIPARLAAASVLGTFAVPRITFDAQRLERADDTDGCFIRGARRNVSKERERAFPAGHQRRIWDLASSISTREIAPQAVRRAALCLALTERWAVPRRPPVSQP